MQLGAGAHRPVCEATIHLYGGTSSVIGLH